MLEVYAISICDSRTSTYLYYITCQASADFGARPNVPGGRSVPSRQPLQDDRSVSPGVADRSRIPVGAGVTDRGCHDAHTMALRRVHGASRSTNDSA